MLEEEGWERGRRGRAKITISVRPSVSLSLPRFEEMHIWPNRMTGAAATAKHRTLCSLNRFLFDPHCCLFLIRNSWMVLSFRHERMGSTGNSWNRWKNSGVAKCSLPGDVVIFVQFLPIFQQERRIHFDNSQENTATSSTVALRPSVPRRPPSPASLS